MLIVASDVSNCPDGVGTMTSCPVTVKECSRNIVLQRGMSSVVVLADRMVATDAMIVARWLQCMAVKQL